jgi:mannose/fructose/N-acetylgalactosamine-specific phosphotransferase system component IIC
VTPGVVSLALAAQLAASRQHRFLWIGMSATAFWVVVAAVAVAIAGIIVAVARARQRTARRRT